MQLFKLLDETNQHLKKFEHINKRAEDQFQTFSKQKDNLCERKLVLIESNRKIHNLLDNLEIRKIEMIDHTFNQVAKYFAEIFQKLVTNGCGQLILHKRTITASEMSELTNDSNNIMSPYDYTGIGIKVSFLSNSVADMCEMGQFSGGQKTLVALALIFAIQKLNPAPFYMFDEIDQALDIEHRKAIADLIHELSNDAQFIMTTFRSELVDKAHKFYGVRVRNKVSYIDCITKDQAKQFVQEKPLQF